MSVETSDSVETARYFLNMDESVCAPLLGSVRIVWRIYRWRNRFAQPMGDPFYVLVDCEIL